MASPRLIPVPDSPQLSAQSPPETRLEGTGKPSASFDRSCAPSQAPIGDSVDYDELSFGQPRELCRQRLYRVKDSKAALKTRLEAMDAAYKKTTEGS